ncbi:MAG: Ig-like domain repeat protein, partial [Oscillospiraceae bacterium]|nr:Ig-like domain repeat protein [Oscillospiraceae bacterium]
YVTPEVTLSPQQPVNGIYNGDVKINVKVEDPVVEGISSGLRSVTYRVLNRGEETQSGTLYLTRDTKPGAAQRAFEGAFTVDSKKNNSNDVVIEVYAEDNALNISKSAASIKIDTSAPQIHISYNNNAPKNEKFYNEDRVATIEIIERNFDPDDVKLMITNSEDALPTLSGWEERAGSGNGDDTVHIATLNFHEDGDYTFEIEYADLAGNLCAGAVYAPGTATPTAFTVDQTLPVIKVSYDNNNVQNDKYFAESRTATITVIERNFDAGLVEFTQTASLDGAPISVPAASWSNSGEVHTATIAYTADGDYTFDVTMMDEANNKSADTDYGGAAAAKEFTIDTAIIKPVITGAENGKSYKEDVIPVISMEDINFAQGEIQLLRTRREEKNVDVTAQFIRENGFGDHGGTVTNDTFEKTPENDGIYTLTAKMTDKAGNEESESITFTVNRFGSVYTLNDYLISLQEAYVQEINEKLVITEYNPDPLVAGSLRVRATCDGSPIDDLKYTVSDAANIGESGWYQYEYTVDASNFSRDGIYKLSVSSEDAVGNHPETDNYEDCNIMFRVDTTPPEITAVRGLEEAIINVENQQVEFDVFDAIGLEQISVYVNDNLVQTYQEFDDLINFTGSFALQEGAGQRVRFVVKDLAGNTTDTDAKDSAGNYVYTPGFTFEREVTVSTNVFVRWYANKTLFWGSIGGGTAVTGTAAGLTVFLRKMRIRKKMKMH